MGFTLFLVYSLFLSFVYSRPHVAIAQTGCALIINEIMYDPAAGSGAGARHEWVELIVASPIGADTTFFIADQDPPAGTTEFVKAFIIPAGTAVNSYIMVYNDGDSADDGTISTTGIYSTISFYMGNGLLRLNNGGDEIVLYQGSDTSGVPCDYVEYLSPNSGVPAGFSWDNGSCANPGSAQPFGTSISLDPNGTAGNSACDWAESGLNSPNDPGIPNTGGPDSLGYNNNTTPTAVSLVSFSITQQQSGTTLFSLIGLSMMGMTLFVKKKNRKAYD